LIEEVDEKGKDLARPVKESSFPFRFVSNLPNDDFGRVIPYTGSPNEKLPPGFKRRVEYPLCHMWFDCFNLAFYYHCEGKNKTHSQFVETIVAHRKAWIAWTKKERGRKAPYPELDRLQQRNLTLDEALKILKVVLLRCDLCPASVVKPYEDAAWSHLLKKHSKDDKFLQTAKAKATSWKASCHGRKPMKPKDLKFIADILEDG
jgi:hypothetical protein